MSTAERVNVTRRPKRVLVYATDAARANAARLMPGSVLEVEVARAIAAGDVDATHTGGFAFLDRLGVVARCTRVAGRLRERPRAWLVVGVERRRG